jgi:hypothetical protein
MNIFKYQKQEEQCNETQEFTTQPGSEHMRSTLSSRYHFISSLKHVSRDNKVK